MSPAAASAPLILLGLQDMTLVELQALDAACAAAQRRAQAALDRLAEQLPSTVYAACAEVSATAPEPRPDHAPAYVQRLARLVAARCQADVQAAASALQAELYADLISQTKALYSFAIAFDQLGHFMAGQGAGRASAGTLHAELAALWSSLGGAGAPIDPQRMARDAGQLSARLLPAEVEQVLLQPPWAGDQPLTAGEIEPPVTLIVAALKQALQANRQRQELAVANHIRSAFNTIAEGIDRAVAMARRGAEAPAPHLTSAAGETTEPNA